MTLVFLALGQGTIEVVPYGDDFIIASRVCICEHLDNEHDFDNPIQACEVCDCTGFLVGGEKVIP